MNLIDRERRTYEEMWAFEAYSDFSPGVEYASLFVEMTGATRGWVLDAGCGAGKGALELQKKGFQVTLCDLTDSALLPEARKLPLFKIPLWNNLYVAIRPHDWVYCCDVLEHIPTPFTMLVVQRLLDVSKKGVFLSISLVPDSFGVWIGKPLHHTVQSFNQWKEQLGTLARIVECRDLISTGIFLLEK